MFKWLKAGWPSLMKLGPSSSRTVRIHAGEGNPGFNAVYVAQASKPAHAGNSMHIFHTATLSIMMGDLF
jgi:hypothetical protein